MNPTVQGPSIPLRDPYDWRERLYEIAEKHCDHRMLKGDCLYQILEPYIRSILNEDRRELMRLVERLVAQEMITATSEGKPTSRLTSLITKLSELEEKITK
jgi:hypothetical protein